MTARRFTIAPERTRDGRVWFDREESHHLVRVLRLRAGDTVVAVDGSGRELTVRLDTLGPEASGTIVAVGARATESPFAIALVQAIPKGDKLETVIRAATELGVMRIAPALSARTVVRLEAARAATRVARWERVAREAAKQCGRARVPVIETPRPLAAWIAETADDEALRLCLWEEERVPLAHVLDALATAPTSATVIIGPEGGLSEDEVASARAQGWRTAGFGPRLLRTETAGPSIIATLQFRYGDLGTAAGAMGAGAP
jgi:16S rRNA (uracil1498-N3)-methyltransferase